MTKKELRATHDLVACDICGRSILKGEHTEAFLAPGGERKVVCELCMARANHEGWIRESAHGDLPARMPQRERRSILGRLRRREEDPLPEPSEGVPPAVSGDAPPAEPGSEPDGAPEAEPDAPPAPPRSRPKDPRHVRAIPTNAEVKIERALEMFNGSEHVRTVAGIARTLGSPWVSAVPSAAQPSQVDVTVAWELSWYQWRVDLGDSDESVVLVGKGEELAELELPDEHWNGVAGTDGTLAVGVVSAE